MYKDTLKQQMKLANMTTIRSFEQQLSCQTLNKIELIMVLQD